ncbi:MAG TPA: carboxypeptidase-like regulatory domain-containing protein [Vicinamibacterales bacterium]|nr:carboxypeptidase-like regulatory domain-containing protein [Vicinamibacterales bacterium]
MTRPLTTLAVCAALFTGVSANQRATAPASMAEVAGTVRAAAGTPAARALVLIAGTDVGVIRVTSTDATGHFAFAGLPPGRFLLGAGKPAYLAALYGAGRPGRPGTTVTLAAGQKISNVSLDLTKGAVIAGHVVDEHGQPVIGARVRVLPRRDVGDEITLGADAGDPAGATTDDRGAYRVFDLLPGDYVVGLQPRGVAGGPPLVAYSSVYFPASPRAIDAEVIHVAAGDERRDVDLRTTLVSLVRVEGVVTGAMGPANNVQVQLRPGNQNAAGTVLNSQTTRPGPDGRFAFGAVPPGAYDIVARTLPPPAPPPPDGAPFVPSWATSRVAIAGAPPPTVPLELRPALSIAGRIVFEGLSQPPDDVPNIRIGVRPTPGSAVPNTPDPVVMDRTGRFTIANLTPGRYRLFVVVPPNNVTQVPDWFPRMALVGASDALDVPITLGAGAETRDVSILLTDDSPEIAGTARDATGKPVRDCAVIVFSTDRRFWFPQSRRTVTRQSGEDGLFVFGLAAGLPPGEYYVAALRDLGPGEQFDSVLLGELAKTAERVKLADGDSKTVDVRLAREKQ